MFSKLKEHCQAHCGKVKMILIKLLLLSVLVFIVFETRNVIRAYDYIGRAPISQNTITITGEGKVSSKPDIAVIGLGVQSDAKTVKTAQDDNTKQMNQIIKDVKAAGVKEDDIQTTNYSIYPKYSYDSVKGTSDIVGYTVSQSVTIKVRELDKTGTILSAAGEAGANTVGGVQFTIDEPETLKEQAREEAIDDAKDKADALFKKLGVSAGRIVSFSESNSDGTPMYYKYAEGMGGGGGSPDIESGSLDVKISVSLTYEIK